MNNFWLYLFNLDWICAACLFRVVEYSNKFLVSSGKQARTFAVAAFCLKRSATFVL